MLECDVFNFNFIKKILDFLKPIFSGINNHGYDLKKIKARNSSVKIEL